MGSLLGGACQCENGFGLVAGPQQHVPRSGRHVRVGNTPTRGGGMCSSQGSRSPRPVTHCCTYPMGPDKLDAILEALPAFDSSSGTAVRRLRRSRVHQDGAQSRTQRSRVETKQRLGHECGISDIVHSPASGAGTPQCRPGAMPCQQVLGCKLTCEPSCACRTAFKWATSLLWVCRGTRPKIPTATSNTVAASFTRKRKKGGSLGALKEGRVVPTDSEQYLA